MQVIIVTSSYGELPTNSRVVGVWGDNESFLKGMKQELIDYAMECYSNEDLANFGYATHEEYAEDVMETLRAYDDATDPIDDSMKWVLHDRTVQYLDYPMEIRTLIGESSFGWKENKFSGEEVFYLDFFGLTFYPTSRDGEGQIIPCEKLVITNGGMLALKDKDGDYWDVAKEPIEKQRDWFKQIESALEKEMKE